MRGQLAGTWYLRSVQLSDADTLFLVEEIDPEISPTLIINDDYSFTGNGACNTFQGNFVNPQSSSFENVVFSSTELVCETSLHNNFENSYFSTIQIVSYYFFESTEEGLILYFPTAVMGGAIFQNYPLATNDLRKNRFSIYPNPSSSFINVIGNTTFEKFEILNSCGQSVKFLENEDNSIDISDLQAGIYCLKIYSENGIETKKIIKR